MAVSSCENSSVRIIRCVLGGILNDESFSIETDGNRMCLESAQSMVKCFGQPSAKCKELGDRLVTALEEIINLSQRQRGKRKDTINQDKLGVNIMN